MAVAGENIAIVRGERIVAYVVPATEPITPELIEWYVHRVPNWTDKTRDQWRARLTESMNSGYRYNRARDHFIGGSPT